MLEFLLSFHFMFWTALRAKRPGVARVKICVALSPHHSTVLILLLQLGMKNQPRCCCRTLNSDFTSINGLVRQLSSTYMGSFKQGITL
jgi:hypothetical protein